MDCDSLCLWIGRMFIVYVIFISVRLLYYLWTLYIFPTPVDFSKYGKWSVITGATAGIGKAMAFELASKGQNIILISNVNLDSVASEIESKYGVKTKCLKIDFSEDEHIYDEIKKFLVGHDIGVLVNNVGIANPTAKFLEIPNLSTGIRNITRINILTVFKMHEIVLPEMVKKEKGIIINLSSASRLVPVICASLYGSSKILVDYFSQTLSYEYEDKGIIIQSLSPAFLKTEMTKSLPRYNSFPTPEEWVKSALNTVGKDRSVHGNLDQTLKAYLVRNLPLTWMHSRLLKIGNEASKAKRQ